MSEHRDTEDFKQYLRLERLAFESKSLAELEYTLVNETRHLLDYSQCIFLKGHKLKSLKVQRLSNVAEVDRNVPLILWIEKVATFVSRSDKAEAVHQIQLTELPGKLQSDVEAISQSALLWLPLSKPEDHSFSALILTRNTGFSSRDLALLPNLANIYGAALSAWQVRQKSIFPRVFPGKRTFLFSVVVTLIMFIPVRQSVLAPAQLTSAETYVVTAPFDGVISEIIVKPNETVVDRQVVLLMEDASLVSDVETKRQSLLVAKAELHKVEQSVFNDPTQNSRVAELKAKVELENIQLKYAQHLLNQARVMTQKPGIAILDQPEKWRGQPVSVGERIFEVADPDRLEITVKMPVKDALVLEQGSDVSLFLDTAPLNAISAKLVHAAYEPIITPQGVPAYTLKASLINNSQDFRLGLRGVAKIYGDEVSLFYYLFRRPITVLRQWLGW